MPAAGALGRAGLPLHGSFLSRFCDYLLRTARLLEDFAGGTNERFGRVDEKLEQLAEAQRRTDERLNILIGVVERYFSNGGRP